MFSLWKMERWVSEWECVNVTHGIVLNTALLLYSSLSFSLSLSLSLSLPLLSHTYYPIYFTHSLCHPSPFLPFPHSLLDRKVFLATWKEIPPANEVQSTITNVSLPADTVQQKLEANNVFTIARRSVEGQELIYMSAKFVNNIWVLMEVKVMPGTSTVGVSVRVHEVFIDNLN